MSRTRLSDLDFNGVKVHREMLPEHFRAFCEKCYWGGPWRSIWSDWNTLVAEITEDLNKHVSDQHSTQSEAMVQGQGL